MSSISIRHPAITERRSFGKPIEMGERVAAAILLLLLSPLLLAVSIATMLLSRRSPLIAHRRVGRYGSELWVLKFRTMWQPQENSGRGPGLLWVERIDDQNGPDLKGPGDARVSSRFARFCR